jgi:hypothetical protein
MARKFVASCGGFALDGNKFDGIYVGRHKGKTWSMPARSTTALTRRQRRSCKRVLAVDHGAGSAAGEVSGNSLISRTSTLSPGLYR